MVCDTLKRCSRRFRVALQLTVGALPDAMRFGVRAKLLGSTVIRSGFEYTLLCLACLFELLLKGLGAVTPSIRRVPLLRSTVLCFNLPTLLVLVQEIFLDDIYRCVIPPGHKIRILDCGSNIGVSTLFFKKLFPESEIIAFEPDPLSFALLQANVEINALTGVSIHNLALAANDGMVDFFRDPLHPGALTMNTIRPMGERIEVPCARLSSYTADHIDLLKMDIEGAELDVLNELASTDALQRIDRIILEYHHHVRAIEDRLSELLHILERGGFGYYLQGEIGKHTQEIYIYCYNKARLGPEGEGAGFSFVTRSGKRSPSNQPVTTPNLVTS